MQYVQLKLDPKNELDKKIIKDKKENYPLLSWPGYFRELARKEIKKN